MRKGIFYNSLLILLLFTSCRAYRYIYAPSPPNNPYFVEKGESLLAPYFSTTGDLRFSKKYVYGFDLQGAYSVTNHFAVTASYFTRKEKDGYPGNFSLYDTSTILYTRNLFDVGAGYFVPLDKKKTVTANLYAGIGSGKFSFNDDGLDKNQQPYDRYHQSHITKWYFQPSINFMPAEYLHISFITKFSYVHYSKIKTSYTLDELQYFSLDEINNHTLHFFEPSVDFQFGLPGLPCIKFDFIYGGTSNYHSETTRLNVRGSNLSIGFNVDFSKLNKKKK